MSATENLKIDNIVKKYIEGDKFFYQSQDMIVTLGLVDVHVHLREPGYSYKETIETGTKACARGGYTHVFSMPNLNPAPDCLDNLNVQLEIIKKDAVISVTPYGTITVGQKGEKLSDMREMSDYVCSFSDDGRGVQDDSTMEKAMLLAKELGKIITAHCENNSLLKGGYIHDGEYAKANGHKGICSESEYGQIARDLRLVEKTKVKYHVCHVSTKESVELIRKAKREGLDVTCETAPHYLILSDKDLKDEGKFKMNPPLRSEEDRLALIEGIKDGTIDMIATDHAPHSLEEKSKGLKNSAFGIVGIETAFSLLYTHLVEKGIITLEKLIELMAINPRKRFGLEINKNDYAVFETGKSHVIDVKEFLSKGKSTPFEGQKVNAKCIRTVKDGKTVYKI